MAHGILAAHDLTEPCAPVMVAAADLARRLGLELTVIHALSAEAVEEERESRPADSAFTDYVLKEVRAELQRMVATELEGAGDVSFAVDVVSGEPDAVVADYVKHHEPEFTFIGIRSRSRVGKLLFGSVPQAILLGTDAKVVTVPIKT